MLRIELYIQGDSIAIELLVNGTRCEVLEDLEKLKKSNIIASKNLDAALRRLAEQGVLCNPNVYKSVGDGLFEIRYRGIRLFNFTDERRRSVILIGLFKKARKQKQQDFGISQAKKLMKQYYEQIGDEK